MNSLRKRYERQEVQLRLQIHEQEMLRGENLQLLQRALLLLIFALPARCLLEQRCSQRGDFRLAEP